MTKTCALFVGVTLIFGWASAASSESQLLSAPAWGESTSGLRIGISASSGTLSATGGDFRIALENIGSSDFVVNLGFMIGNGKVMFPRAVRLSLVGPGGDTQNLEFLDRGYPGVAGRMDDFIVALRAGSTYTFATSLDHYWSTTAKQFPWPLAPGRHRIVARFEGQGAVILNSDMQGVGLLNFWKGTTQSGNLDFEVVTLSK